MQRAGRSEARSRLAAATVADQRGGGVVDGAGGRFVVGWPSLDRSPTVAIRSAVLTSTTMTVVATATGREPLSVCLHDGSGAESCARVASGGEATLVLPAWATTETARVVAIDRYGGRAYTSAVVAITGSPPVITSPLSAMLRYGVPFSYQITATNDPVSFGASGLPSGLSLVGDTISGTVAPDTQAQFSVTISATNAYGTGTETLALAATLSDPSLWIGAWLTTSLDSANLITSAPGGRLATKAGAAMSMGDANTSVGRPYRNGNASHAASVNAGINDFTIGAWMRGDASNLPDSTPYLYVSDNGGVTNYLLFHTYYNTLQVSGTYGTPSPVPVPGLWIKDSVFRHYAFVYNSTTRRVLCYRDGVQLFDVSVIYDLFGGVTPSGIGLDTTWESVGWMRNPVMTREMLSQDAISALAAGRMPNSSGLLV